MTYGSVDEAVRYLIESNSIGPPSKQLPTKGGGDGSIDKILADRVDSLATILIDIQGTIDKRQVLSGAVIDRIYAHYFYVKKYLCEIARWPLSANRAIEQRRSKLENMLDTLLAEKRREQILCFQDIANLKRDFWRWFKEYCDLVQRLNLMTTRSREKPKNT